jgi:hypothetical protein
MAPLLRLLAEDFGKAATCGYLRIASYTFTVFFVVGEVYCIYGVWSFMEEITYGINAPDMMDLLVGKDEIFRLNNVRKGCEKGAINEVIGVAHDHRSSKGPYPSPYGAATLSKLSWQTQSLFGGKNHELDFPPRRV